MPDDRQPFTITCVRRDPDAGFWRARVTPADGGQALDVDRRHGSWQADVRVRRGGRTFRRADLLPHVSAALQARVRPLEKRLQSDGGSSITA